MNIMAASLQDTDAPWVIRSEIDGRLRIFHPGLSNSLGLRRHCGSVLHRTHWLISHRINVVSSTVVIRFPLGNREHLLTVLNRCFVDPFSDTSLETALAQENQLVDIVKSQSFHHAVRNGALCASVLAFDSLMVVPPLALATSAIVLNLPLLRHFLRSIWKWLFGDAVTTQNLLQSSVEVALSTTLISGGLARESLLDGLLDSSKEALQSISQSTGGRSKEFVDFIERLKNAVLISPVDRSSLEPCGSKLSLGEVEPGMLYSITIGQHVFLHARLVKGELLVVNALLDGSSLPLRLVVGDEINFGAYVLQGEAVCEALQSFSEAPVLSIEETIWSETSSNSPGAPLENLYRSLAPPLQLGFGMWSLVNGLTERAISFLAFNPLNESEKCKLSSAETALVDMALNQVHIADARVLSNLSAVDNVLISINALQQLGSFECREQFIDRSLANDDLIQILYSIALSIKADPATVFWGVLTDVEMTPLPVQSLEVNAGELSQASYVVKFDHQSAITIRFYKEESVVDSGYLASQNIVEFSRSEGVLGRLLIDWSLSDRFSELFNQLRSLNVNVEVVGDDLRASGSQEPLFRCSRVKQLKRNGATVAYLGDVIDDIPAMSCADVAIGLSNDDTGFVSKTVCDVILGGDPMWLSRLIVLSRRYESATKINSSSIVALTCATSLAGFVSALTPAQSIALFNLVPIVAELNTLFALSSSASRIK
tara:strand:+ start:806 stop:2950 length:2145 start_codon:yes stop_codon:yes gene_type:complete